MAFNAFRQFYTQQPDTAKQKVLTLEPLNLETATWSLFVITCLTDSDMSHTVWPSSAYSLAIVVL